MNFAAANISAAALITLNGGGLQWATGNTTDISGQLASIGAGGATFDTNGNNVSFATALGGTGGLTKAGTGTLTLSGANFYSGATTVNAGTLQLAVGAALPVGGALAINGGTFATNGNVAVGALSGTGGTINLVSGSADRPTVPANTTLATTISGAGGFTKAGTGTLTLTGANTYTGGTAVSGGTLVVNGSIAGNVAVGSSGTLGGTGTIAGNVAMAGNLAPGNSIGTLTVTGNFAQNGSTYAVEVNPRARATGSTSPARPTITGGTVQRGGAAGQLRAQHQLHHPRRPRAA